MPECTCIKIHADKAFLGTQQLDLEETILFSLETWGEIELRRLYQAAFIVILPTMVFAREEFRRAAAFSNNSVCTMPADVVERSELQVLTEYYEKLYACERESVVVARLAELALVTDEEPRLRSSHYKRSRQEIDKDFSMQLEF
jgi:hypothetical protein